MKSIVLASGNQGKLKELQALCSTLNIKIVPQSDFNIIEAEETGLSFIENAIIKARHASQQCGLPAIADDSGLEVEALNGAPGIYSARFSGENANDKSNNKKLLADLSEVLPEQRHAAFRCCLAFIRHPTDPCPIIAEGIWRGHIGLEEKGSNGFGYDPLFLFGKDQHCSAELEPNKKNKISHRALALEILLEKMKTEIS